MGEKPTYKRPSREAIASALPINHPSKTPTLASEQRNARPPQPPQRRLAQKWPDCRPVASGLESHSLEPKKVTTTTISRPPHLPKREK